MKVRFSITLALMMLFVAASCSDAKEDLAKEVHDLNKQCPSTMEIGTIKHINYEKERNAVVYHLEADRELILNVDDVFDEMKLYFFGIREGRNMDAFTKLLKDADCGLIWEVENPDTKTILTARWTSHDIVKYRKGDKFMRITVSEETMRKFASELINDPGF